MAASAHLAVRAMIQCARDQSKRFPDAAKKVESCMYMDDSLAGCDTVEEAMVLCREIDVLLRNGGFELGKWASNCSAIQNLMHGDTSQTIEIGESDESKILRLRWIKDSDELTISVQNMQASSSPTKRQILSDIARLYDPNGLIGPVIVKGKILMQNIWRENELNWDSPVPAAIKEQWIEFHAKLQSLSLFRVPRWL